VPDDRLEDERGDEDRAEEQRERVLVEKAPHGSVVGEADDREVRDPRRYQYDVDQEHRSHSRRR
jgi:hypothetical protein